MVLIQVNPQDYYDAGKALIKIADGIDGATTAAANSLQGTGSMAGSTDDAKQWAARYDTRATHAIFTGQRLGNSLRHYADLIVTAGFRHDIAEYDADPKRSQRTVPVKPTFGIVTVHQAYVHPPAAGGPGKGLVTVIPNLVEQIGLPVPDGDTSKLDAARQVWSRLDSADGSISTSSKDIGNVKESLGRLDSPEISDIWNGLDDLSSTAASLKTSVTALAKDCGDLLAEHASIRKQASDILTELVHAIELQIAISIAFTFVSAGVGALLDTAVVAKFAKNITDAAEAIGGIIRGSKIARLFAAGAKAEDEVEGAARVLDEIDSLSAEAIDKEAAESAADGGASAADQGSKAVVDDKKYDYLFGRAAPDAHNSPRSLQNLSQLNRIGVFDNAEGRNLIAQNLNNAVSTDSNIVRTFSDQYGTFQVRDSLLAGPNGVLKLETTWQVMTDGKLRMTTVIPMGGG